MGPDKKRAHMWAYIGLGGSVCMPHYRCWIRVREYGVSNSRTLGMGKGDDMPAKADFEKDVQ